MPFVGETLLLLIFARVSSFTIVNASVLGIPTWSPFLLRPWPRFLRLSLPFLQAWMKTAWANCLAKDADVTHVSVWVDAGYRRRRAV